MTNVSSPGGSNLKSREVTNKPFYLFIVRNESNKHYTFHEIQFVGKGWAVR